MFYPKRVKYIALSQRKKKFDIFIDIINSKKNFKNNEIIGEISGEMFNFISNLNYIFLPIKKEILLPIEEENNKFYVKYIGKEISNFTKIRFNIKVIKNIVQFIEI